MHFNALINTKVSCTATVSKIIKKDRNGNNKVVFEDIYTNDVFLRDHTYVNMDKRLSHLKLGDKVSFTALIIEYPGYVGDKKLGIKSLRNVIVGSRA